MRVLITPQFNASMRALRKAAQKEVMTLFSMVSAMEPAQFVNSPLLTKLATTEASLYTLRGRAVRIFCSFDTQNDILFLDVGEVGDSSFEQATPRKSEITMFGRNGEPIAYVATDDDSTIYSFAGEPLAYLDNDNVYGFNGMHLGWFEDGVLWNHQGQKVGFTQRTSPVFTRFEPFKGFKRFKPFKAFKQFAPFKPLKSGAIANEDLLSFLKQGAN
jgi:mRNA-degrading endonuclease RelE of RelBE toxin-antitoxin system